MKHEEYWNSLGNFKTPSDVPRLPIPLTDFHILRLKDSGAIPKSHLVENQWYIGKHRCTTVAKWNGTKFSYIKEEFSFRFFDECNHFEDDDGYSLFVPLRIADPTEIPQDIPKNGK
jgi:hypothetical protein